MTQRSNAVPQTKSIAVYVYDGVEPIDIGGTYGVFSMARRVVTGLDFFTVSETKDPVELSGGLRLLPDHDFSTCPKVDALIVCGGPGWTVQRKRKSVTDFIMSKAPQSIVASVCTGGLILAATDLLNGLPATTRRAGIGNEKPPLQVLGDEYQKIDAIEARVIDCGQVITGGGVSLAIDLSLHLLGRLFGEDAVQETSTIIEYNAALAANKLMLPTIEQPVGA